MASATTKKEDLIARFGEIRVFDDILRLRAADEDQVPILGIPTSRSKTSEDEYETFTGQQLEKLVNGACQYLENDLKHLEPVQDVVALLAPTTLDLIVTFFALQRMGFPTLLLSTRNTVDACVNLIENTDCKYLIAGHNSGKPSTLGEQVLRAVQEKGNQKFALKALPVRKNYELAAEQRSNKSFRCSKFDEPEIVTSLAMIFHSSGSTGNPKPVRLSHKAISMHPPEGRGLHPLITLPWYHAHGLSTSIQAIWQRKTIYCIDSSKPIDGPHVIAALNKVRPEILHTVPYTLSLVAETDAGVEALKNCQLVTAAGAPLSDDVGDKLVAAGVNVAVVFGASEFGVIGDTMNRSPDDTAWQYMTLYPSIRHFIEMRPIGDDQYEAVFLKEHPAIAALAADGVVEDYFSGDVFEKHPTFEDRWKSVGRKDDRITLENGEKFAPLLFEAKLKGFDLVDEVICFGNLKPAVGAIVFVSKEARHMPDDALRATIWSFVQDTNRHNADYAQVGEDMIFIEHDADSIPRTDKRSIKRKEVLRNFASKIEALYHGVEAEPAQKVNGKVNGQSSGSEHATTGDLAPSTSEPNGTKTPKSSPADQQTSPKDLISKALQKHEHLQALNDEDDFFEAGMNSLQAIQLDRALQRSVPEVKLGRGTTYKYANVASLTAFMEGVHLAVQQMKA